MTHDSKPLIGALALVAALAASPAAAQWIDYKTPGIPRTKDGKPNLSATAPRQRDGKPDLSGVWAIGGLGFATRITNVEMLPEAQKLYKQRLETYGQDDPAVRCLPEGPRTGISGLEPLRIVHTPNFMAVLFETGGYRQIFLDGRPLPKDPTPTWLGYSTGHWEGDTLVVETIGYNDKTWLDFGGHPHSEALRMTERFRRKDFGHMRLDITFDDPKIYTKPFTIGMDVVYQADTDVLESICLENEKDHSRLVGKPQDEKKDGTKVAPAVLAQYVGSYDFGPFGNWAVSADAGQLFIDIGDGSMKHEVFAQSDTMFLFPAIGGSLTFGRDARGAVSDFTLTIVEGDFKAMRKK